MKKDVEKIYSDAITACLPDSVVREAVSSLPPVKGKLLSVAIGKAAWKMSSTAAEELGDRLTGGIVITKYHHSMGDIPRTEIYEAGHPVPDENTIAATERVLEFTSSLTEDDMVLFLVSGGGSALFESVECGLDELQDMTRQLLAAGASIGEINTLRKHLSKVKGGKFAEHVAPARVYAVLLSDVLGNDPSTIASGPACPDSSCVEDVHRIIAKYSLSLSPSVMSQLERETPKALSNSEYVIGGSVTELCAAAKRTAESLGFKTEILTDCLDTEARYAGEFLSAIGKAHKDTDIPLAYIAGGETVVHLKGRGKGGRNQELALSAALAISGYDNIAVFSVGSDGTDGPTDAAGGCADGGTADRIRSAGIDPLSALENNDAYNALSAADSLIVTGPTGTNVNDISVVLIYPKNK